MQIKDFYEIKNKRLILIDDPQDFQGEKLLYDKKYYSPTENFGDIHVGEYVGIYTQFKYVGPLKIDKLQLTNLSEVQQTNFSGTKEFTRKYRIKGLFPFKEDITPQIYYQSAPDYWVEYILENTSSQQLTFNKIQFKPDTLFECITMNDDLLYCLEPKEQYRILFKLAIKPEQVDNFERILRQHNGQQEIFGGTLLLEWGQFGTFVGAVTKIKINICEIIISLQNPEDMIMQVEQIKRLDISVQSLTNRDFNLAILIKDIENEGIKVLGTDLKSFILGEKQRKAEFSIHILAVNPGIHLINSLQLINQINNLQEAYKNCLQIQVQNQIQTQQIKLNEKKQDVQFQLLQKPVQAIEDMDLI